MKIKLIEHAIERANQRGTTEEEIARVLAEGKEIQVRKGRKAREMVFNYGKEWLGRVYTHKKVVAIYKEEDGIIVVITVKVYYGEWR